MCMVVSHVVQRELSTRDAVARGLPASLRSRTGLSSSLNLKSCSITLPIPAADVVLRAAGYGLRVSGMTSHVSSSPSLPWEQPNTYDLVPGECIMVHAMRVYTPRPWPRRV